MFSASIVDAAVQSCGRKVSGKVVVATPEPSDGHRKYRQAKQAAAKTVSPGGKNFGVAEAGDSEVDSSITQVEVTEVVRKLLSGKALGGG
ncbi:hypothetical protein L3Q82_006718 [Scortum barcoo]|uniref:Uncharacterized protein n=1 Tax=Scortum barcoo TaxID=214431 RepID=A0ACB8WVT2_9TELE|nr:hypothetical protein L3Q82_006718 [Scortum barcoo]